MDIQKLMEARFLQQCKEQRLQALKTGDYRQVLTSYDILETAYSCMRDKFWALYNKMNKLTGAKDFVIVQQPDFQVTYIDKLPLFDGATEDETEEVFVIEKYFNHTLFEKQCIPTSQLNGQSDSEQALSQEPPQNEAYEVDSDVSNLVDFTNYTPSESISNVAADSINDLEFTTHAESV